MINTVTIAVIGNSNSGKTSFIRSIIRDLTFGRVGITPTTTSVDEAGSNGVRFKDTPGFEYASKVRKWVQAQLKPDEDPTIKKIVEIISQNDQDDHLSHDKIAWNELKEADAILYLIDVGQNPENKDNSKASCLLLPRNGVQVIFNRLFEDPNYKDKWSSMIEDYGREFLTHDYDVFRRNFDDEIQLLENIKSQLREKDRNVLIKKQEIMDRYIQSRIQDERVRLFLSFNALHSLVEDIKNITDSEPNIPIECIDNCWSDTLQDRVISKILEYIKHFQKEILTIWGFNSYKLPPKNEKKPEENELAGQTIVMIDPKNGKKLKKTTDQLSLLLEENAMIKLVNYPKVTAKVELSTRLEEYKVSSQFRTNWTSLPPWIKDKLAQCYIKLKNHTDFCDSFYSGGLQFIHDVRNRGIATTSQEYPNPNDAIANSECKIDFSLRSKNFSDYEFEIPQNLEKLFLLLFDKMKMKINNRAEYLELQKRILSLQSYKRKKILSTIEQ